MTMIDNQASNQTDSNLLDLARGVVVNIGGKAFGRGIYIINQIILARILGPGRYGLYGVGWIIFRIASILSTLGLDSGVIHHTSEFWEKDKKKYSEVVISGFISSLFIGSLIGLSIYLFSEGIADIFNKPELESVLRKFSFAIPAMAGLTIVSAATRVSKDMKKANLIEEIILPCIMALMTGAVYLFGGKLDGYVIGTTLAISISLLLGLFISSSDMLTFQISWKNVFVHLDALIRYSLPITLPVLFGTLINIADRILTGYFLPEFDTGIYQSVSMISALFVSILSAFKTMAAPMMAEYFHAKNKSELKKVMVTSSRWVVILCAPFFLIIFLAPKDFISIVFGENYLAGAQALVLLAVAQLINIAKGPVDQLLIMTGNQKRWLWVTVLALVINFIANVLLIPSLGIIGAALAQVIAYSILAVGGIAITMKQLEIFFYNSRWLLNVSLAGFTAIPLYALRFLLRLDVLTSMIITCLAAGIIYISLLSVFGLTKNEKDTIKSFFIYRMK